jgi:hypothetical protein
MMGMAARRPSIGLPSPTASSTLFPNLGPPQAQGQRHHVGSVSSAAGGADTRGRANSFAEFGFGAGALYDSLGGGYGLPYSAAHGTGHR